MNTAAQTLEEVDLNDPDALVDGTGNEETETEETTTGQAANEDKKPTREEQLASAGESELRKLCAEVISEIDRLEKQRTETNAKIQAARERLEAKGISKKALSIVLQISRMNEDHLDGFDTAYLLLRKSINLPVQSDMFNFRS